MDSENRLEGLVCRCQHGEQTAFEQLFRRFQPRLRYYVRRLDTMGDHVEDTLQDIWVKVVREIGSLKDPKAFVAWLYAIARHEAYGRARIKDPFVELTDEHLEQVPEHDEPVFTDEDATRIHPPGAGQAQGPSPGDTDTELLGRFFASTDCRDPWHSRRHRQVSDSLCEAVSAKRTGEKQWIVKET
jgi:RNA polymerase sigma factor (sigma-70 family)